MNKFLLIYLLMVVTQFFPMLASAEVKYVDGLREGERALLKKLQDREKNQQPNNASGSASQNQSQDGKCLAILKQIDDLVLAINRSNMDTAFDEQQKNDKILSLQTQMERLKDQADKLCGKTASDQSLYSNLK